MKIMNAAKILSIILLASQASFAASTTAAAFLKMDSSARSYALGQSGVVSALGAEAIGSNPANLTDLSRKMELLTTYSSLTEGVSYAHIAGAVNRSMRKNMFVDALGFSYTSLAVSGLEGRDNSGNRTSDFGSSDSQMSISMAGNYKSLKLGLTGKIVQSKIASFKANTVFAADMGASCSFQSFGKAMTAGASLNNLGQQVTYLSEKDSLPTSLNMGLTTDVGPLSLTGGLTQKIKTNETNMNFGMEFNFGMISLRAGVNALGGASAGRTGGAAGIFEGLSSGIGLKLGMARVDYALGQESADLGISQRMSLTLQFGKKAK